MSLNCVCLTLHAHSNLDSVSCTVHLSLFCYGYFNIQYASKELYYIGHGETVPGHAKAECLKKNARLRF